MTISATTQGIKPGVCTSTNRPSAPFDGQVIYMTDVDQTAVWDGSAWTVLAPIAGGRNVIINGAMQIAQRGTSVAGITGGNYYTADRWTTYTLTAGTWTNSIEADGPAGSGLAKSNKWLCTTANSSLSAGSAHIFTQPIEGQNLQRFAYGSALAQQVTLSFWVKSNVTGTYIAELDSTRRVSASYTISVSGTWERKTVTFPVNTVDVITNDNSAALSLRFWLVAGSTFSGGSSLATTWGTTSNTRAVGQTNLAAATNNYWQVTGVQLEAGAVATPFEFEDYGTTLQKCKRYYQLVNINVNAYSALYTDIGTTFYGQQMAFPVTMRTSATLGLISLDSGAWQWVVPGVSNYSANTSANTGFVGSPTGWALTQTRTAGGATPSRGSVYVLEANATIAASAEL